MCGAMISLTPCIASTIPRECDFQESREYRDADDMIRQLNDLLAFHRFLIQGKTAISSRPSQVSAISNMSSVLNRIVNGLSICQTRAQAWLKHLAFRIVHCGNRECRNIMTGSRRSIKVPRHPRSHGPGKKALPLRGLLLLTRDLPSEANLFLLTSLSAQIQRRKVFHGEISENSMLTRISSIRVTRPFHVQWKRQISYLQSSR